MTDFAAFRPENYPRTYKKKIQLAVNGYIAAGIGGFFAVFCLLTVAIKYHGNLAAGGACSAIGLLGLIISPIGFISATAPRLKLTADVIEYRDIGSLYVVTRRMRRDDIKGVSTIDVSHGSGRYGSFSAGTTFIPKDEKASAIFMPEWVFQLDEAYDAWVGGLPYLGGSYNRYPFQEGKTSRFTIEDFPSVEWRDHKWLPRKK